MHLFRRFVSVSTPPISKIDGFLRVNTSKPLVVKFLIEIRHTLHEPIKSINIPSPPKNNQSEYDMESTLSHIMRHI